MDCRALNGVLGEMRCRCVVFVSRAGLQCRCEGGWTKDWATRVCGPRFIDWRVSREVEVARDGEAVGGGEEE